MLPRCRYHLGTEMRPVTQKARDVPGTRAVLHPSRTALRCPIEGCPAVDVLVSQAAGAKPRHNAREYEG